MQSHYERLTRSLTQQKRGRPVPSGWFALDGIVVALVGRVGRRLHAAVVHHLVLGRLQPHDRPKALQRHRTDGGRGTIAQHDARGGADEEHREAEACGHCGATCCQAG